MLKPISTEKAINLEKKGKYTFWVDPQATKLRIKAEVARTYKVKVISVKTLNIRGRKKAIVILEKDQKINLYEKTKKNS